MDLLFDVFSCQDDNECDQEDLHEQFINHRMHDYDKDEYYDSIGNEIDSEDETGNDEQNIEAKDEMLKKYVSKTFYVMFFSA